MLTTTLSNSRQTLKKFVQSNNVLGDINDAAFNSHFNRALAKGSENGTFARPKGTFRLLRQTTVAWLLSRIRLHFKPRRRCLAIPLSLKVVANININRCIWSREARQAGAQGCRKACC